MNVRHFRSIAFLGLLAACLPGAAGATLIDDTTKNVSYRGTAPINWFAGGTSVGDVVEGGPEFDTQKVDVTTGPLTLQLSFYTQFDGDDLGAHYADIFIASDPAHPDNFDHAIALGSQLPYGGVAQGLYALAANYQTSIDRWKGTGYIYGGEYVSPNDGLNHDAPTVVTGGSPLPGWTVTVARTASGDATYPYLLSVTLAAASDNILKTAFSAADIAIMWGTGDCNNDAVYLAGVPHLSNVPPPHVPEPPSIAVLITALIAFGGIARQKRGGILSARRIETAS